MTDIKMSDVFDLPIDCHDFENQVALMSPFDAQVAADAINAHDENQERIKELESHAVDMGKMAKNYVSKISNLTHENALLENQLNNAIAEIAELKKKARGY